MHRQANWWRNWWNHRRIKISVVLLWFCFPSLCDWSNKPALLIRPIKFKKLKPISAWSPAFSRALSSLLVLTLSSHWFLGISHFALIGWWNYFSVNLTTLDRNALLRMLITLQPFCAVQPLVELILSLVTQNHSDPTWWEIALTLKYLKKQRRENSQRKATK